MDHLEDDDETEGLGQPLCEDFIPIVRLLIVPYIPIFEFTENAGPNSTANGPSGGYAGRGGPCVEFFTLPSGGGILLFLHPGSESGEA
ncbi:hypothetical protein Neosp_003409 [[Neocosmospora] mangrovei]